MKKRNGNVEVLRCLLMLLIVFHHAGYHGYFARPPDWWSLLIWGFVMWHVDAFVAISGWYGITLRLKKFLSVYGVILFYSLLGNFIDVSLGQMSLGIHTFIVYGGWFGGCYLMLMLISPIANASLEYLRQDKQALIVAWLLFAIGMTLSWAPCHLNTSVSNGAGPYSTLCLLFIYISARTARFYFIKPIPKKHIAKGLFILPIGICICGGAKIAMNIIQDKPLTWSLLNYNSTYDAPHIWIFALLIVMLFVWHLNLPGKIKTLCTFLGPSMFGIYQMHEVMHNGRLIYQIPQEWLHSFGLPPLICVIMTTLSTFLLCLAVDLCRRLLISPARKKAFAIIDLAEAKLRAWTTQHISSNTPPRFSPGAIS